MMISLLILLIGDMMVTFSKMFSQMLLNCWNPFKGLFGSVLILVSVTLNPSNTPMKRYYAVLIAFGTRS